MTRGFFGSIAFLLVIIGGLNWGLIGAFDFNAVHFLFGSMPMVQKVVYILVGVSAVFLLLRSLIRS